MQFNRLRLNEHGRLIDSANKEMEMLKDLGFSFPKGWLVEVSTPMDGHSLYHALALCLNLSPKQFREQIAQKLEKNPEPYRSFIVLQQGMTMKDYIEDLRTTHQWAGELEIVVLMKLLQHPIVVIGPDDKICNQGDIEGVAGEPVFVGYNGTDHYCGLIIEGFISRQEILEHLCHERPVIQRTSQKKLGPTHSHQISISEAILFIVDRWREYVWRKGKGKPFKIDDHILWAFKGMVDFCCSLEPAYQKEVPKLLYDFFYKTSEAFQARSSGQEEPYHEIETLSFAIQHNHLDYLRILLGAEAKEIFRLYGYYSEMAEETWIKKYALEFIRGQQEILEVERCRFGNKPDLRKLAENMSQRVSALSNHLISEAEYCYQEFLKATYVGCHRREQLLIYPSSFKRQLCWLRRSHSSHMLYMLRLLAPGRLAAF